MASPDVTDHRPDLEALASDQRPIPPAAHVLVNLQRLLADPNAELDTIANLIQLDAAMAARVIQVSNSAWFGRTASCETILEAVNRIGFREVYHVVSVLGSAALISQPAAAYRRDAMTMWRESVSCAFAAEMLADRAGEDRVAAYMAGLLHGVGRLSINRHLAAQAPGSAPALRDDGFPLDFSASEFACFGFHQGEVGAALLRRWKFPPTISEPIRRQYEPLETDEPYDRIAAALYGARLLRTLICQKTNVAETPDDAEIFAALRLSREEVLAFLPQLQERMARANRMTRA